MAYGIEGTTATGGFLIDSNTSATEYLTVVASGTVNAGSSISKTAGDLLFAKPFNTSSSTANRVIIDTASSATATKFLHKVYYIKLQKAQNTNPSGNDYGIQIKNAANAIIFDSRTATSGVKILGAKAKSAYAAAAQPNNSAGQSITSPQTSVGSLTTIIHAGNPTNVYVSCSNGFYEVTNVSYQLVIGGFYYDYANNRILAEGYFDLDFSGDFSSTMIASSDVLTGELVA